MHKHRLVLDDRITRSYNEDLVRFGLFLGYKDLIFRCSVCDRITVVRRGEIEECFAKAASVKRSREA